MKEHMPQRTRRQVARRGAPAADRWPRTRLPRIRPSRRRRRRSHDGHLRLRDGRHRPELQADRPELVHTMRITKLPSFCRPVRKSNSTFFGVRQAASALKTPCPPTTATSGQVRGSTCSAPASMPPDHDRLRHAYGELGRSARQTTARFEDPIVAELARVLGPGPGHGCSSANVPGALDAVSAARRP